MLNQRHFAVTQQEAQEIEQNMKQELEENPDELQLSELTCIKGYSGKDCPDGEKNWKHLWPDENGKLKEGWYYNHYVGIAGEKRIEHLNPEYLDYVLDPLFVEVVRQVGDQKRPVRVPVGNLKMEVEPPLHLVVKHVSLSYWQKEHNFCLVYSVASCLHYMAYRKEAAIVAAKAYEFSLLPGEQAVMHMQDLLKEVIPQIAQAHIYNRARRKKKGWKDMSMESLVENKSPMFKLVIPFGNDGSKDHAICVVDDLIFDARLKTAFCLNLESLNWVCGKQGCKMLGPVLHFCESFGKFKHKKRVMKTNW